MLRAKNSKGRSYTRTKKNQIPGAKISIETTE